MISKFAKLLKMLGCHRRGPMMILNKFMIIQRIQHITRIFWKQDNLI